MTGSTFLGEMLYIFIAYRQVCYDNINDIISQQTLSPPCQYNLWRKYANSASASRRANSPSSALSSTYFISSKPSEPIMQSLSSMHSFKNCQKFVSLSKSSLPIKKSSSSEIEESPGWEYKDYLMGSFKVR